MAEIAVGIAQQFGCSPELQRDVRRAALLHDIGKLGVSNLILDKPGKPTAEEFAADPQASRLFAADSGAGRMPSRTWPTWPAPITNGSMAAAITAGLMAESLPWVARVLAVADICEAMSAKRPYRDAMPWEKIQEFLHRDAGTGVDAECVAALERWQARNQSALRVEAQLCEVERLLGDL